MNVRLTKPSLAKVGVELISRRNITLSCMTCGAIWSPDLKTGGHLPRGWWKCPNNPEHTQEETKPERQ